MTITANNPLQLGFEFALWTRAMIREWIRDQFGVRLSDVSVGRLSRKLGLSPQRPPRNAYQRDEEKVKTWRKQAYPEIQKLANKEGAAIYFGDEASVRSDTHSGTTWAPTGEPPVIETTGARFSLNMVSAVSAQGLLRFMTFDGRMNADRFIEFLKRLIYRATTPIFLILDGHPVHKSKLVKEFVASTDGRLRLFILPPYSPHLHPNEWVWNWLKRHKIRQSPRCRTRSISHLSRTLSTQFAETTVPHWRIFRRPQPGVHRSGMNENVAYPMHRLVKEALNCVSGE